MEQKRTKIAVFGLGYVGCVTAACLADLGFEVIGVDRDQNKVDNIRQGAAPFFEPGLEALIQRNIRSGRLSATGVLAEAASVADIIFVCVGTPSERNGNLNLEQLSRVTLEMAPVLKARQEPVTVAIRSTVFPGTCDDLIVPALADAPHVSVVVNPEFLREGCAIQDFLEPSLLVVGGDDRAAVERVAAVYGSLDVVPCLMPLRTAEMVKYACNSFHALKIAFANEIGAVCGRNGISGAEVMETLCRDTKLNTSSAYLKPGFAFGGSCLPKDLRALNYRSTRLDLHLPLMSSILPSNEQHLQRAIGNILDLPATRLGIYGLSFKPSTDDLRESAVITLIESLIGKGRSVRIFDPSIKLDRIYGSNKNFVISMLPHIGRWMDNRLENVIEWAEALIVTQAPSAEAARLIQESSLPILDVSGTLAQEACSVQAQAL